MVNIPEKGTFIKRNQESTNVDVTMVQIDF